MNNKKVCALLLVEQVKRIMMPELAHDGKDNRKPFE